MRHIIQDLDLAEEITSTSSRGGRSEQDGDHGNSAPLRGRGV